MTDVVLAAVIERLDAFARLRMAEEGTPGLVLALTDRDGPLHAAAYGFANVESGEAMTIGHLLETGSIGKSFTAIAILQLHEEGRIDLHAPIREYLPWFEVRTTFDQPTIHHALSHTSGLIYGTDFAPDPRYEVWALRESEAANPPGTHYHYSNVVYKALGLILERLEGKPYEQVIRERMLDPLGMDATVATITHETRRRMAQPYRRFYDDRPGHPSHGLVPATWLETNTGDGCLASSIVDLATYIRMYLNRGQGKHGRVLSKQAFDLMTSEVIDTGDTRIPSHTGYGVRTSELNDSLVVHHSGGVIGYISAMLGDINAGLGAVAIVNGPGRPWDVARYGLELLQAVFHRRPLPDAPPAREPSKVENAVDYAGTFTATDGRALRFVADGERLLLACGDERITLDARGADRFYVPNDNFALFLLQFSRNEADAVTEANYGADWFASDRHDGPTTFDYPAEWDAFPGHYRAYNPWFPTYRVVVRKGQLLLIGPNGDEEPLLALPDGAFRVGEDEACPERCRFDTIVDGVALRMRRSSETYYRFFTP